MKKTILAMSVAAIFVSTDINAFTLPDGAVLSIDTGKFNMGGSSKYTATDCSQPGTPLTSLTGGAKGLFVGPNMGDFSTGPHGGAPAVTDVGGITDMWTFFGSTGVNYFSQTVGSGSFSGDTDPAVGVDMSSWIVGWNATPVIEMGSIVINPPSQLICGTDCSDGDTYTIIHAARVPTGSFSGVRYDLCLTGTITGPGSLPANAAAPTAMDDSGFQFSTDSTGNFINVRVNDTDPEINDAPDPASIDLDPATAGIQSTVVTALGGRATVDPVGDISKPNGGVLYDAPGAGIKGMDSFNYTIGDFRGATGQSNIATVSLEVLDLIPTANDDGTAEGAFVNLSAGETDVSINVLANDVPGDFPIDPTRVNIQTDPLNGTAVANAVTGEILYTPNMAFEGLDTFTYTVRDDNNARSNVATVSVRVADAGVPIGPFLLLKAGVLAGKTSRPADGNGSYFTMELSPGELTYTAVAGFNDIEIGTTQSGTSPDGPNIDEPWMFFGNLGIHQTTGDLLQLSNDDAGTITFDFTVWDVSWNAIPSINLGNGQDNGIATLTCFTDQVGGNPGTCLANEIFLLTYRAIVPDGDPSGFGGVNYTTHFEGIVSPKAAVLGCDKSTIPFDVSDVSVIDDCTASSVLTMLPGATANSVNNTTGIYLAARDIDTRDPLLNLNDGGQCMGGCLDFIVNGIATDHIDLVVRLSEPLPQGAIYRKLYNGKWQTFDTSNGDTVGSAPLGSSGNCQSPNGAFKPGLRAGNQCLFLTIFDGGPNDADGIVNGTVIDPSGVALAGSPNAPTSSSDGCSISKTPVKLIERGDWLIVASFIVLMGLVSFKRRRQHN